MNTVNSLDAWLFPVLYGGPGLDGWAAALTIFTAQELIWIFPIWAVVAMWRGPRDIRRAAALGALACGLSLSISYLIGVVWPRPRPFIVGLGHALVAHAPTSSFPSNHAAFAYAFVLTLFLVRQRLDGLTALLFLTATVIGVSRVVVGIHYPTDIVGGFILALMSSLIVFVSAGKWRVLAHIEATGDSRDR